MSWRRAVSVDLDAPPGLPLPLTGRTRVYAILGDPIAQAGSPALFNAEFRRRGVPCVLVPLRVRAEDLGAAFDLFRRAGNLDGLVLTVPHKMDALRLVDDVAPNAARMGAVNAVRKGKDGRLQGENFDGLGFLRGLRSRGHAVAGRHVLIVGCGGAGMAVACALASAGVSALHLADVDDSRARALADRIRGLSGEVVVTTGLPGSGFDMAVNCTSLGMKPGDPLPIGPHVLDGLTLAVDIVLEPLATPFLRAAEARGIAIQDGRGMLAGQISAICDFFL